MAWPPGDYFENLIRKAQQILSDVHVNRFDISVNRGLIDLEGRLRNNRVIISEIHRMDGTIRYAYYMLDQENRLIHGFDNSPDVAATRLGFSQEWKSHLREEIPHQHDQNHNLTLTEEAMTSSAFLEWLAKNDQSNIS